MRQWLYRFAQWRGEVAKQLNENDVWRQVTEICVMLCFPVIWLAKATLRIFPGLKKLEWLLEIEALTRRNAVVLALSLLFVFWRGIMTTPLGHIGTDKLIYPTLGALSGFNPFLGMVCGATYGVADLLQKLWWPDMYGANGWMDLNYWGAMVGYCVTYLTIMGMGLFPGMASRACRAGVVKIVRGFVAKRATQMADGGVPLGAPISPVLEMVSAATGGLVAGWGIMYGVAPTTTMPAFLWRPNPDVSCWQLEVDTHLKGYATVGGTGAAVGGVANVAIPPPEEKEPEYEYPDEFEWTFPNGVKTVIRKDADGQYINILTGGVVDVTDLQGWSQSWENIYKEQREWGDEQMEKLQKRDTEFDRWIDEQVEEQKLREKVWENLSQMERNIVTGNGPESELYRPPGDPGNILDHIRDLRDQLADGKAVDKDKYEKIYKVYRAQKEGRILQPSQIPTESELTRDIFNGTVKNTALEFVTGTDSEGKTSWLGIIGRGATAVATGGASEMILVPANALNTMKNYVDKGGNSSLEGFKQAVVTVLVDELTGRATGKVINLAAKGGSALVKVGSELVKEAAENGSSVAKNLVKAAQQGGKAASTISKVANKPIRSKPLTNSTVARAPKSVTPDGGKWVRDAQRAGSTNVRTVPSGKPVSEFTKGFTEKQVKHINMVSNKYGVKIDVRPTNPHAAEWIRSGKGVPKPAFLKTKTLSPMDEFLGAKGAPGQVGYYRPKLPPKGSMSNEMYDDLKKLYAQRMKEFKAERGAIKKAIQKGEAYVKDGVVLNGKPPNGKPFVGDIDVMDVRDPVTGRPLPRYQVDHKGNYVMDPKTGQPKLNPVRQAIMDELGTGPAQTQHGTHMDWKYDHKRPPLGTPPDAPSARDFAHDQKIDQGVLNKHRGPNGEPVISYGPDGPAEAVFIEGGR